MSILDKHPAPWTAANGVLYDGSGSRIPRSLEVERFLQSAPVLKRERDELLCALKERVDNFYPRSDKEEETLRGYEALIARIEGGNG